MDNPTKDNLILFINEKILENRAIVRLYGDPQDEVISGIIIYTVANGIAELIALGVCKEKRGLGIGKSLVETILENPEVLQIKAVADSSSQGFFEKIGFVISDLEIAKPGQNKN